MSNYQDWIIPLPAETTIRGKPVFGLMPCICGGQMTVRLDKNGKPTAYHDRLIDLNGCGRQVKMTMADISIPQTHDQLMNRRDDFPLLSGSSIDILIKAWGVSPNTFNGVKNGPETPAAISSADQSGLSENSGKSESEQSGKSGNEPEPEPAETFGNSGISETNAGMDQSGERHSGKSDKSGPAKSGIFGIFEFTDDDS